MRRHLPEDPEEFRLSFIGHLEELRTRLIRSLMILLFAWVGAWFLQPSVYRALEKVVMGAVPKGTQSTVAFHTITDPFMLKLSNSLVLGIMIASPLLILQLWAFIAPGLKPNERLPFQRGAPAAILLFAIGCFFGWIVLPSAYEWFGSYLEDYGNAGLFQDPLKMVSLSLKMLLAFGIGFQLPLITFILYKFGILRPSTLNRYWRHSTVIIFIVSAVLTPSNDPFSMLMMALPLTILFFGTIVVIRAIESRQPWPAELNRLDV
ncbi:MAG: twin-arginine translocase subunit TatC [Chthonomonas sp.]|nr:twin-arginine translocase subunit TatC [Chthonomonas sp.]